MNIFDFAKKKRNGEKITLVTCYDYTSAQILSKTNVDCLLVGDTVAMLMHGYKDTLAATVEMMCMHTSAVSRGASDKFILGDLPFLSYRKSLSKSVDAVQAIMCAGAHAIKLEGASGNLRLIKHLVESGVPVMGHLGLTPQSIATLGGYKVQGKTDASALKIKRDAKLLEDAGCFAIVLECVPQQLAHDITQSLQIPTIGIGAGAVTDGQVLVYQDMLGMFYDFKPKFVKHFLNGGALIKTAIDEYVSAVQTGDFPQHEHSY